MTFLQLILLYFCTVVCALYLLSGGYKVIRNYVRRKIDDAAVAKVRASAAPVVSSTNAAVTTNTANQMADICRLPQRLKRWPVVQTGMQL